MARARTRLLVFGRAGNLAGHWSHRVDGRSRDSKKNKANPLTPDRGKEDVLRILKNLLSITVRG